MNPEATADQSREATARAAAYDTSEMLRQVFVRALSVPSAEDRHRLRPTTGPGTG